MTGSGVPAHPGFAGGPVYLDHNATPPVDPRVAEAMLPHLTDFFGDLSSSHPYSRSCSPPPDLRPTCWRAGICRRAKKHEVQLRFTPGLRWRRPLGRPIPA